MTRPDLTFARRRLGGFTLLEVMIALAILFVVLVMLLRISNANARATMRAKALTVATALARGKMLDIEEALQQEVIQSGGFQAMSVGEECKDFSDEGYPKISYCRNIEKVELPSMTGALEQGTGQPGSQPGMPGMFGLPGSMLGGTSAGQSSAQMAGMAGGASMLMGVLQPLLEGSIRKVTLTVKWRAGKDEEALQLICFYTDTTAMDASMAPLMGLMSMLGGGGMSTGSGANPGTGSGSSPMPNIFGGGR